LRESDRSTRTDEREIEFKRPEFRDRDRGEGYEREK